MCLVCHPRHYEAAGSCSDCHRGDPRSSRKNIAHSGLVGGAYAPRGGREAQRRVESGKRLIERFGCRRCHLQAGRGNRLAMDLDQAGSMRSPVALQRSIRYPVDAMPDFRVDDEQAVQLVSAILAGARPPAAAAPLAVHFSPGAAGKQEVFTIKCGGCHRLLSEQAGPLGSGRIGPNLSGLLSTFYAPTFRETEAWTPERLKLWLDNPRGIRPWAGMLPVRLNGEEFRQLLSRIRVTEKEKGITPLPE